jgi:hypothetical protein
VERDIAKIQKQAKHLSIPKVYGEGMGIGRGVDLRKVREGRVGGRGERRGGRGGGERRG